MILLWEKSAKIGIQRGNKLIPSNGLPERLLFDNEIGRHAGDWRINCRSVAVVFDNDYEDSKPSEIELKSAAKLIKTEYPAIAKERIFGHREINPKTTCPSNLFLSTETNRGWKEDLLDLI